MLRVVPLLITFCSVLQAGEFKVTITPREGEKFKHADYSLWVPEDLEKVRVLIVHQHGCGDGAQTAGRTATDDLHWRALAEACDGALLGSSLWPNDTCRDWCDPTGGSDRAYLEALDRLAASSGHPELKDVGWIVWGHSGGGFWAHRMLGLHPDRFIGVVMQSAGFGKPEEWPSKKLSDDLPSDVWMLIHVGEEERKHERFGALFRDGVTLFHELRAKGAPAALAVDPASGHNCGDCRYLSIPWIQAVVDAHENPKRDDRVERPTPDEKSSSVLPGEDVARVWSEFIAKGAVADTTPPEHAPTDLKAVSGVDGVVLTWKAQPDLESGLKSFRIYRDDEPIGPYRAPLKKAGQTTEWFRKPNYSDTPSPPLSQMRFVDDTSTPGASYQVSVINGAGLEGPKSAAVTVGE